MLEPVLVVVRTEADRVPKKASQQYTVYCTVYVNKSQPRLQLCSTQKHDIGRPLLGIDAEHMVNERREKSRMVGAVGELRSTEVGGMEETLNGVEGMVPGDRERGGFRNRPKCYLEIRQVRDLLEVVANIIDTICVS